MIIKPKAVLQSAPFSPHHAWLSRSFFSLASTGAFMAPAIDFPAPMNTNPRAIPAREFTPYGSLSWAREAVMTAEQSQNTSPDQTNLEKARECS